MPRASSLWAAVATKYSYEYTVRWWDPFGIQVSEARPYALWNSNGSSITACAGNTNTWWWSTDGWYEVTKNVEVLFDSAGCISRAYVRHQNDIFQHPGCRAPTTVYYWPIWLEGRPIGPYPI